MPRYKFISEFSIYVVVYTPPCRWRVIEVTPHCLMTLPISHMVT